jgi:hypothetical protein
MNDSQAYILHLTCEPSLYSYCQNRSAPFAIGVTNITEFKFSLLELLNDPLLYPVFKIAISQIKSLSIKGKIQSFVENQYL